MLIGIICGFGGTYRAYLATVNVNRGANARGTGVNRRISKVDGYDSRRLVSEQLQRVSHPNRRGEGRWEPNFGSDLVYLVALRDSSGKKRLCFHRTACKYETARWKFGDYETSRTERVVSRNGRNGSSIKLE